jgi:hypothetical protein
MLAQKLLGASANKSPYFFGSSEIGSTGTTSLSLDIPSSIPSGATIYVFVVAAQISTTAITISVSTSGYTERRNDQINSNSSRRAGLWSKVADGTETSVTATASATSVMRLGCIVIDSGSGYQSNSLFQNPITSNPDPQAVTFTNSESVALVIYYGAANVTDAVSASTLPSGYSNAVEGSSAASTRTVGLFGFYKESVASGSENPPSFSTSRSMSVHTVTVAHES